MDRDRDGVDDRDQRRTTATAWPTAHETTARHDRDGDGVDDRREGRELGRRDGDDGHQAAGTLDDDCGSTSRHDEAVERDRPARFDRDEADRARALRRDDARVGIPGPSVRQVQAARSARRGRGTPVSVG